MGLMAMTLLLLVQLFTAHVGFAKAAAVSSSDPLLAQRDATARSLQVDEDAYTYYDGSGDGTLGCSSEVPMDLVFVLGTWQAMSDSSWTAVRSFAADFVKLLTIGSDEASSRVGVITFSSYGQKRIRLQSSTASSSGALDAAITSLSRGDESATRYSYIWSGIQNAFDMVHRQKRATARPVVVFISDGMPAINETGTGDWHGCEWPVEDWPGSPGGAPSGEDRGIMCARGEAERIQDEGGFFAYVQLDFDGTNGIAKPMDDELARTIFKRGAAPFQDPDHPYNGIGASVATSDFIRLRSKASALDDQFAATLYTQILNRICPTATPSAGIELGPTQSPSPKPTLQLTHYPTRTPTPYPTRPKTPRPTQKPTTPSPVATEEPTPFPTPSPTLFPTPSPTRFPSSSPTPVPTLKKTEKPTPAPTPAPTVVETSRPTSVPTESAAPTRSPAPTPAPTPKTCLLKGIQYDLELHNVLRAPVIVESALGCQVVCQLSSSCVYFSWNASAFHCYLKTKLPTAGELLHAEDFVSGPEYCGSSEGTSAPTGSVSGVTKCLNTSLKYPLETNNLFSEPTGGIESAASCQEFCHWQPSCEFFTFSVENDLCYLKDSTPEDAGLNLVADEGYISGPPQCGETQASETDVSTSEKVLAVLKGLVKSPYLWIGVGIAVIFFGAIGLREYNLRGHDPNSGAILLRTNPAFSPTNAAVVGDVSLGNRSTVAVSELGSLDDSSGDDDSGSIFTEPSAWTRT